MQTLIAHSTLLAGRSLELLAFWLQPSQAGAAPAAPSAGPAGGAGSPFGSMGMLLVFVAVFYFFIIRPGNKQRTEQEQLLKSVMKGDRVVTTGGMYGIVSGVDGDIVVLEISEKVRVRFKKEAIAMRVTDKTDDKKSADKDTPSSVLK
ncbi:MAG: preprotein translocase subunit YajC [Deltaproteobacteria bacterium]|nr:preprotein translocase subunit YajC [Deltaproteobacteria bacterium]